MKNVKINTIILSRLFCTNIDRDCVALTNNAEEMLYYSKLAAITIAPSLKNQTDQNFEHVTIINDKANPQLMNDYSHIVRDAGLKTKLVPYSEYVDFIKDLHNSSDAICLSEMDLDDLVHNDAILLAKRAYVPGRLTVHGYQSGLRFDLRSNSCLEYIRDYKRNGHIRIMQSFIFDKQTPFYEPYSIPHVYVLKTLQKNKDKFADKKLIKYGDLDCKFPFPYVYVKHARASTSLKSKPTEVGRFPENFSFDDFRVCFGISPNELQKAYDTI